MVDTQKTKTLQALLKYVFGVAFVLTGLDKFFNLTVKWSIYLSDPIRAILPIAPDAFMWIVGVFEVLVGVAILTEWTVVGAYVGAAWLVLAAVNLYVSGFVDIGNRDVLIAVGLFSLGRLTEATR